MNEKKKYLTHKQTTTTELQAPIHPQKKKNVAFMKNSVYS